MQAPDQIAQVLRALVSSEAFSATPPAKIRRPFEYLAALYRATGAGITATGNAHAWQLSRAGWQMHSYGPPAGHPDTAGAWTGASTLNRMVDMALYAHEAWFEIVSADFAPEGPDESFGAFVARHAGALAPNRADEVVAVVQNIYDFDPAERVGDIPVADREGLARMAVAFAALAVGSMRPGSLIGAKAAVAERLEDLLIGAGSWLAPQLRARLASGFGDHGALQVPMTELVSLSDALNALIWSEAEGAVRAYAPDQPYPEGNGLSEPLMTVAQAIKSDMGLRVATVDVPGWETHVNQADPFSGPARGLSEAVMAFWRDLGSWQQDVSVVVMSEFARRLRSNTAGGTDHGRGNAMMILGPQARGGRMVGAWPGLTNDALEAGADLAVVTDYRSVLSELLTVHLGLADPSQVFPGFKGSPIGLWS